jgi:hypothetical protein
MTISVMSVISEISEITIFSFPQAAIAKAALRQFGHGPVKMV